MMNEPNYEAIGRCTVLERRINSKLEKLRNVKMAVSLSESSYFLGGALILDHSAAECIEDAANKYRELMVEITGMAREHNKYAPSAGIDVIDIQIRGLDGSRASDAETFLRSHKLKQLVAFSKELELAPETQWLACFMQDEIAYLIQKVEMATDCFSSVEHVVNRTSAWLWMIMRAFKAMPHAPLCLHPEQVIGEWESRYATENAENL
ncbi:hypothetical protein HX37_22945 [Salmonella enterica]|uniref:Uncharacterized protein n=1 Tax=Salmonella enterica TaxID=28901 RepID=A0A5U2F6Q5_SALER|nr:hypothetical protein [Salmonella enterica]